MLALTLDRFVPENLLKKQHRLEELKAKRQEEALKHKKVLKQKHALKFKRAEQYVKEYRAQERSLVRFRRQAKKAGQFFVEPEAKVAVVVRIRGILGVPPKAKKILQLLRLRQVHNAVFVRLNKATINMLRCVEPYIAYGYPNLKTVHQLIYKRGYGKIDKQRVPLSDNRIIEEHLGKQNVICMEDMVHEIVMCGEHFKEVNNFLWPFKLRGPTGGFKYHLLHYCDGGDAGNREEKINELIQRMV